MKGSKYMKKIWIFLSLLVIGLSLGGTLSTFSVAGVFISIYIVVATIVSYGLWYAIVQKYDLSKLFVIKMLEPIFACVVSTLLPIGATLDWHHLVALIIVGIAIIISNTKIGKNKSLSKVEEEVIYESDVS